MINKIQKDTHYWIDELLSDHSEGMQSYYPKGNYSSGSKNYKARDESLLFSGCGHLNPNTFKQIVIL